MAGRDFHRQLHDRLVDRVPGIRERYQEYRGGHAKIPSLAYLGALNFEYYVLKNEALRADSVLCPDEGRKIVVGSESELTRKMSPKRMADRLETYDVISFDVFDTLILRKVAEPADVFYALQEKFDYPDFRRVRIEAEQQARRKRHAQFGDYEVSFEEIWAEAERMTGIDAALGMRVEFETEIQFAAGNPYFQKVIADLVRRGKRMIVCSDMYLGKERIRELLLHCGYPEFSAYYVSCDYRKSKYDGSLYDVIRRESAARIIQVGDDPGSDVRQAHRKGFASLHYQNVTKADSPYRTKDMSPLIGSMYSSIVNGYLHNGTGRFSREFEFGFIYGGLFAAGYCRFIHSFAEARGIDRILFLSRDGEILMRVYQYLYPEEAQKCRYALWSRLAGTKMCASLMKSHFMQRMVAHKADQGYTFADIFDTMEIRDMLGMFLSEYPKPDGYDVAEGNEGRTAGNAMSRIISHRGKYMPETELSARNSKDLMSFLDDHWEEVCAHYETEIAAGKRYYEEILAGGEEPVGKRCYEEILAGGEEPAGKQYCEEISGSGEEPTGRRKKIVVVDAGWVGSGAITLRKMLCDVWKFDCDVYGLLAGTASARSGDYGASITEMADGKLFSYLFSASENRDLWKMHDPAAGHNMVLELLLCSAKRSFRGFAGDGQFDFSEYKEKIDVPSVQRGILKFAELYKAHPWASFPISGRDAAAPIMLLCQNSEYVSWLLESSGIRPNIE